MCSKTLIWLKRIQRIKRKKSACPVCYQVLSNAWPEAHYTMMGSVNHLYNAICCAWGIYSHVAIHWKTTLKYYIWVNVSFFISKSIEHIYAIKYFCFGHTSLLYSVKAIFKISSTVDYSRTSEAQMVTRPELYAHYSYSCRFEFT